MFFSDLWSKIRGAKTRLPSRLKIADENIDNAKYLGTPFTRNQHYFMVVVNEMFLTQKRNWFSVFSPVVMVTSEFVYDGKMHAVPFLVGPTMLENKIGKLPNGFIFQNTTVAGQHPYRGGDFAISIVLAKLKREDYIRKIMKILESTSATYMGSFGKLVSQYTKVADIVLDGIDELLSNDDLQPVVGQRNEFQALSNDFLPGYYVLIDAPEEDIDPKKLYIRKHQLYYGNSADTAEPFRDADYVLYSILSGSSRNDIETLPFHQQFRDLQQLITGMPNIDESEKALINGKLFALQGMLRSSPDLIRPQVSELIEEYREEIKQMIDDRRELSGERKAASSKDPWEEEMDKQALEILNLK